MAADDLRQLPADEIGQNQADIRLALAVLLTRLRKAERPPDTG